MTVILKDNVIPPHPVALIGIAGLAGSGKDTVADKLQEIFGPDPHLKAPITGIPTTSPFYSRYSFAEPIKKMLLVGLGLDDKSLSAESVYGEGNTYRKLAQTLGTEWGRNIVVSDIWLRIAAIKLAGKRAIISDVRMENEAAWIRSVGGIVIHLERYDQEFITESYHASEGGVQKKQGDYKILNEGSLEDLYQACEYAARDIGQMLEHKRHWGLDCLDKPLPAPTKLEEWNLAPWYGDEPPKMEEFD